MLQFPLFAQEDLTPEFQEESWEQEEFLYSKELREEEGYPYGDEDYDEAQMTQITQIHQERAKTDQTEDRNWWHLLKKGQLDLSDTTVVYPKFLKFCVDVYNWGDKFFNSYNPEYVVGTGHRWKARIVNENWTDSYLLRLRKDKINMRMLSHLNDNIGAYLHYMAVSVGYSVDLNTVFKGKKTQNTRFETNFNCALFNFDLYYYHSIGTSVRNITDYNINNLVGLDFPDVVSNNFGVSLYYFLNNKKYSQGAAYNFSKFQKKSAGSWMFGITYSNLDISMDFRNLNDKLEPRQTRLPDNLHFHYFSYCALFGYGYNWVWHPKWLFNVTAMPSVGFNNCYEDSSDGQGHQFALNLHGRLSLTFNHKLLFVSLIGKATGNWYISKNVSLLNGIEYFSLNVGMRF